MSATSPESTEPAGQVPHKGKRGWLYRFFNDTPSLFPRLDQAFSITLLILVVTVGAYILSHKFLPANNPPWSDAVTLSNELLFEPQFNQAVLERYISPSDMTEFKKGINDRCDDMARFAIRERQHTFQQISLLSQEGLADQKPPFILQSIPDQKTENDYRFASLTYLRSWLETNSTRFAPARKPEVDSAITALQQLNVREIRLKMDLEKEINCLQPVLAFNWLYIDHSTWVVELVAWCSFGVLANTIIKLIKAMREKKYDAKEYCMIFPKAILAPVLALVITALWASGLSDSKISFTNLPYLLVLFFLLGFATEDLYDKIVGLANLIVTPTAAVSQIKMDAALKESRYKYTTPRTEVDDKPAPKTLAELKAKLSSVAKSAFERGIVSRLENENEDKQ